MDGLAESFLRLWPFLLFMAAVALVYAVTRPLALRAQANGDTGIFAVILGWMHSDSCDRDDAPDGNDATDGGGDGSD